MQYIKLTELKTLNEFKIYARRNFVSICSNKNLTIILSWPERCSVTIKLLHSFEKIFDLWSLDFMLEVAQQKIMYYKNIRC